MMIIYQHFLRKFVNTMEFFVVHLTTAPLCYPHYIVLLRFLMSIKRFIFPLLHDFFT